MLVLGDLACPNSKCANLLISDMQRYDLFRDKTILCNLEGMIRDDEPYFDEKLFNHSKVLDAFESTKTVFSIANNHTYDYPEQSKKMIVLELSEDSNEVLCHWFLTDEQEALRLIKTEKFVDGDMITHYSPYRKMDDREYLKFFKKNRIKWRLVSVFTNFQGFSYSIKEFAAIYRIKVIKKIKH